MRLTGPEAQNLTGLCGQSWLTPLGGNHGSARLALVLSSQTALQQWCRCSQHRHTHTHTSPRGQDTFLKATQARPHTWRVVLFMGPGLWEQLVSAKGQKQQSLVPTDIRDK